MEGGGGEDERQAACPHVERLTRGRRRCLVESQRGWGALRTHRMWWSALYGWAGRNEGECRPSTDEDGERGVGRWA